MAVAGRWCGVETNAPSLQPKCGPLSRIHTPGPPHASPLLFRSLNAAEWVVRTGWMLESADSLFLDACATTSPSYREVRPRPRGRGGAAESPACQGETLPWPRSPPISRFSLSSLFTIEAREDPVRLISLPDRNRITDNGIVTQKDAGFPSATSHSLGGKKRDRRALARLRFVTHSVDGGPAGAEPAGLLDRPRGPARAHGPALFSSLIVGTSPRPGATGPSPPLSAIAQPALNDNPSPILPPRPTHQIGICDPFLRKLHLQRAHDL